MRPAQWKPLVLSCWEELKGKLRQSVEVEKHQQRLALACAALANHRFQTIQGTVWRQVKVGDISFTQSDGARPAGNCWRWWATSSTRRASV